MGKQLVESASEGTPVSWEVATRVMCSNLERQLAMKLYQGKSQKNM